jgi:hypothetical protein
MKKPINIGFVHISSCFIFLFLFIFSDVLGFSLKEFAEKITFTKMSNATCILYFLLIIFYIITLIRQSKLKFNSYYPNLILIIIGIILFYFFTIFAKNAISVELTVEKNIITYKTENFTIGVLIFKLLQLFVGVVIILSTVKCIIINRRENNLF